MAAPILLLGLGGLALVAMSGGKKTSKKSSAPKIKPLEAIVIDQGPTGNPWDKCVPPGGSGKGVYAAFGKDRKCMVFWDNSTMPLVDSAIDQALKSLSAGKKQKVCAPSVKIPDPYSPNPELNFIEEDPPERIEFVRKVVIALYPQLKDETFPTDESTRYFPYTVWQFVYSRVLAKVCGNVYVT